MRKRLVTPTAERRTRPPPGSLDLERDAVVEVTSEDKDFPVESAFVSEDAQGWRAEAPGRQTIRLIFDQPQRLTRISLVFEESTLKEIVRQQWNFSPPESTREIEDYQVDLENVNVLELVIKPDIGGGVARASLKNLRVS